MDKLKIFSFVAILTLLLYGPSCSKTGFAKIDGKVVDDSTGTPLVEAEITITRGYGGNGDYHIVGTTKTNADGHYSIKYFKKRQLYRYYIYAAYDFGTVKRVKKKDIVDKKSTIDFSLKK